MRQTYDDIRLGLRGLIRNPGMSTIAILTLAIGIGANTAIFSVVYALLMGALPFPEADRLVTLWQVEEQSGSDRGTVAPANFLDWQAQNDVFESMTLWGTVIHNLTGASEPRRRVGARVTSGFFEVLGVSPMLGRPFAPDDDHVDAPKTVILSHELWRDAFDANHELVGQIIQLSETPYTVIGVMGDGAGFPSGREYWVPMAFDDEEAAYRDRQYLQSMGRLAPGVSLDQAQSAMILIGERLEKAYPESNRNGGIALVPLRELLTERIRPAILMLFGAVGLVLLIACSNVANLLLVRGASRGRELGIRSALGAGRFRLVRQLLTESLVLALTGGLLGIVIAFWSIDLMATVFADRIPAYLQSELSLSMPVLVFAIALSGITGLLFGLIPAMSASRVDLVGALKDQDHSASLGRGPWSLKSALVVGEIALSMVLLVGAVLLTQSLQQLMRSDTGFQPDSVLTMRTTLPMPKYEDVAMRVAFYQETLQRVRALPEVSEAGAVLTLPFSGSVMGLGFLIEGLPEPEPGEGYGAFYDVVTTGYFKTMGIPLLQGRDFTTADDSESSNVIVISEAMANEFWPEGDSIGQRITFEDGETEEEWMRIVGIVGDVMHMNLGEERSGRMYTPHAQSFRPSMTIVARTSRGLLSAEPIRNIVHEIDPDQPIVNVALMEDFISDETALPRMTATLSGGFAGVALLLASIGLYGVMSFGVSQRTKEIGIRMALGAHRGDVVRYFLKQGMILIGVGLVVGLGAALIASRIIASQLYHVSAFDPTTLGLLTAVLALVALLAMFIPVRRATKVDPMVALRHE
ncbi:MAG: ABC transporter permease [Planctomycetota bacterium]|nr:ABC transporter permease [Planctomycetota bacterium]